MLFEFPLFIQEALSMKKLKQTSFLFAAVMILFSFFTVQALAMDMDTYTVKKDDTLWKISKKYHVQLSDIIMANPQFADPNLIYPGEIVHVPLKGSYDAAGLIGASMTTSSSNNTSSDPAVSGPVVTSQSSANTYESQVLKIVNAERAKKGIKALTLASDVSNCARVKSEDMRDRKYFSHQSPVYGNPFEMLKHFGIKYKTAGENIAKGQKSPEAVMNAWMNSEGHRKNILNANFKEIGIGYVSDSKGTTYWTQQFITR